MSGPETEITEDLFLNGKLRLRQPKRGHRAGHDAILLAAATSAKPGDRIADFGAGVGAAGLAVATRVREIQCILLDIDPALVELARTNASLNSFRAEAYALDVTGPVENFAAAGLYPDSMDAVLMNPPFNDAARHRSSPNVARQVAHMAEEGMLAEWIHAARRILKPGRSLTMIWRADGLSDVLSGLKRGFGAVGVLPVHPDETKPAIRIIVSAIKGSGAPTTIQQGLFLKQSDGSASPEAEAILGGGPIVRLLGGTGSPPK
ncbi:MAG: methyltransferase [Afipia sp.]|nr:methyltransferase [Afipia sp.]